jgi:tyrosinase
MAVRVRQDIWALGDENDPWRDPTILAYAKGVKAMQDLDASSPDDGRSWQNQSAIHQRLSARPERLENQCQHASWYFLPWHRIYLFEFELIIRSHLTAAERANWALPYWNYTPVDNQQQNQFPRRIPPAFREQQLPDGTPNPLFVEERNAQLNINGGGLLPSGSVRTQAALAPLVYTQTSNVVPGFGGIRTGFHQGTDGTASAIELTPHGSVHTNVGGRDATGQLGFMATFSTAALDPIFWLHHCNLDRLWELWLRNPPGHPPGQNPTDPTFLGFRFPIIRASTGARVTFRVEQFLDIEGGLQYTYSGLPPHTRDVAPKPAVSDAGPPEMVGASEKPVTLTAATSATTVAVGEPKGPAARDVAAPGAEPHTYLRLDDIGGDVNPGLVYGVYLNLPDGEEPTEESAHYAGALSFFGIERSATDGDADEEEAPHELAYSFDVTPLVASLKDAGAWNPGELHVTFSPLEGTDDELKDLDVPPVTVGKVSVYVG